MAQKTAPSTAASKKQKRITFDKSDDAIKLPSLIDHQKQSFDWFVSDGLGEIFEEINPIEDYTGTKLELRFKQYRFEDPKMSEMDARENNVS